MPKRSERIENSGPSDPDDLQVKVPEHIGDEEFLSTLRNELVRTRSAALARVDENRQVRTEVVKRLLEDLWEIHNMFDEVNIHMTMEPTHTTFATFAEFPKKWSFKDGFDFASVSAMELKDRTPGWVGDTLRIWYYTTQEGKVHLRVIFEWCQGETYQRYSGWMRIITQVVLYDSPAGDINVSQLHGVIKDVVVAWHSAHLNRDREKFLSHLREKYPAGTTQAKSYS
jgi:hypothetical protein